MNDYSAKQLKEAMSRQEIRKKVAHYEEENNKQ